LSDYHRVQLVSPLLLKTDSYAYAGGRNELGMADEVPIATIESPSPTPAAGGVFAFLRTIAKTIDARRSPPRSKFSVRMPRRKKRVPLNRAGDTRVIVRSSPELGS
jgi:hypothetical protein